MSNITAGIPFQPFTSEAMVEELLSRGFDLSAYAECNCADCDEDEHSITDYSTEELRQELDERGLGIAPDIDDATGHLRKIYEARKIGRDDLAEQSLAEVFREVLGVVI